MVMTSDDERPRGVTLALISAKLDTVLEKLAEFRVEQAEHDDRIRELETDSARLKERLGLLAGVLIVVQLLVSAASSATATLIVQAAMR